MSSRTVIKQDSTSSFSKFCDWIIVSTLQVTMIFVPLFFLVKNEEVFEFNKMLATYTAVSIILVAWGCKTVFEKKLQFKKSPLDWYIVFFIFSQLISTALSIHPRTSIFGYYTRFHGGLLSTLSYFILYYATATFIQRKHLYAFLAFIFAGAFLATAYAFPEHFGHSPSCLILTNQFDASCWIQDVQTRVFGTFGQPNWLAAYLILLIPLTSSMLLMLGSDDSDEKKTSTVIWKVFIAILGLMMFATLIFTKSRSGMLGFLASFGISVLFFLFHSFTTAKRSSSSLLTQGLLALAIAAIALIFGTAFTPTLSQLFAKPSTTPTVDAPVANVDRLEAGGTDSGDIRRIVWKGAIDVWKRYPIYGSGVETFGYSYYRDRPMEHNNVSEWDFLYNKAHNELLNFLATTGAVGLTAYLLLHAALAWFLCKEALFNKDRKVQNLSVGVLSGLIALHISNFFGFSTVMVTILMYVLPAVVISIMTNDDQTLQWSLFSLKPAKVVDHSSKGPLTAFFSQYMPKFSHKNTQNDSVGAAQWLVVSIMIMIGIFLIFKILTIWLADHYYSQAKDSFKGNDYETAQEKMKLAIQLSPAEGLYYELLSKISAQYAIAALEQNQNEFGTQLAQSALTASDISLMLNPVHLNFYKTRNQVMVTLAQAKPDLYDSAIETLHVAETLAPTDPKLVYYSALVEHAQGKDDQAIKDLQKTVDMKPNYDSARFLLAQLYEIKKQYPEAKVQYEYILEKIAPNNEQVKGRLDAIATMSGKKK